MVRVRVGMGMGVGVHVRGALVWLGFGEIGEARRELLLLLVLLFFGVDVVVVVVVVGHATARGGGPRGDPWACVRGGCGGAARRHALRLTECQYDDGFWKLEKIFIYIYFLMNV